MEQLERALEQMGISADDRPRFYRAVRLAVEKSFHDDLYIAPSRSEVKRRVDFVVEAFLAMRAVDPPMSVAKIVSELYPALRAKLDRRSWQPSSRALFVPASVQLARGGQ